MREHIELVYILQSKVEKGILYFFRQIIFGEILLLTLGCLDNIYIFFDSCKIRILVFYMREHIELVYILKNRVEKGIVYYFWQIVFREIFPSTLGCLDNIYIFFDLCKIRNSVFYMREHIEFVYILQNSVQKGIVYFFWRIIFRAILLLTLGCLDHVYIFFRFA